MAIFHIVNELLTKLVLGNLECISTHSCAMCNVEKGVEQINKRSNITFTVYVRAFRVQWQ